jgi:hypothetical protein
MYARTRCDFPVSSCWDLPNDHEIAITRIAAAKRQ